MSRTRPSALHRLAERVGILAEYLDQSGAEIRRTSDETRIAILRAMGHEAASERDARAALRELVARERARVLEPVRVLRRGSNLPAARLRGARGEVRWQAELELEGGEVRRQEGRGSAGRGGRPGLGFDPRLPLGYHTLRVTATAGGAEHHAEQLLISVPRACRPVPRVFGLIANLYTARSAGDWGIGDLSTLAQLLEWTAAEGGAFVGVNPLHALRNRGWDVSPYSPVSRLFRNPIYLDPTAVPSPGADARAVLEWAEVREECGRLRASGQVEYERVMALKRRVLEALHAGYEPGEDYERYRAEHGQALDQFAAFEALADHFAEPDWRRWPEPYRRPDTPEVQAFGAANARAVDFHRWLQFELDRQLGAAADRGRRAGLRVGLYQDLAIGTAASGADVWANPHLFLEGLSIGAPPDDLGPTGQNWGLPPIDPWALREDRYRFWIRLLRASLRHAGALRIDHVLGLFRQFWIPEGMSGADGAYIRFPADDLLGILVLEATRQRAVAVGEDLGTVPPEVPPELRRRRILSSRVFYFERQGERYRPAADWEPASLATANTHDLPPIAGYWSGRDLELRRATGAIPSDEALDWALRDRAATRRQILARLAEDGLLPSPEEPADPAELRGAVHAFLCGTPAAMVGINLDDLVGEREPVNLPGVMPDRYSSWTRRLALPVEALARSAQVRTALRCGRR